MSTLAHIPLFSDCADLDFERFDRRCLWKRFDDGEIVVDFEDLSTDVYFIVSGAARILFRTAAGKEIILAEMHAGQFFGELAAIDGIARSANVTALSRSQLCIMPAAVFRDIIFQSQAACDKLLRLLASRVRQGNARITEHAVLNLKHRLYAELLRLSHPRNGHEAQRIVTPPPFHHVIAARIGCRREQISRALSALVSEGLLEKTRGGLILTKPKVLQSRLDEVMRNEG